MMSNRMLFSKLKKSSRKIHFLKSFGIAADLKVLNRIRIPLRCGYIQPTDMGPDLQILISNKSYFLTRWISTFVGYLMI